MKLDTTKIYYLGDLSDKQLEELLEYLKSVDDFSKFNLDMFKKYLKQDNRKSLSYYNEFEGWSWCNNENAINALTLFTQTKDERIAQIQLRIQELNNELIEVDKKLRDLDKQLQRYYTPRGNYGGKKEN